MKYFAIRSQLVFVSAILLATLGMMLAIVMQFNMRWDFTQEKIYSISLPTRNLLEELSLGKIKVTAFYPKDDPARANFEFFLKECQLEHPNFSYNFYDPDRVPRLAKKNRVNELYTVIVEYDDRKERIVGPTEEAFANALLRLANPKEYQLCFVRGHGEATTTGDKRDGYELLIEDLESDNYFVDEILLARDGVPKTCDAVVIAGPHRDFDLEEFEEIRKVYRRGDGILFLIDPMDPGSGAAFREFFDEFGIALGEDVIVDKMSRMVGGDFLVPLVSQYVTDHPITDSFDQPTFFPVARSVQPNSKEKQGMEVVPLALSGSGSWAEADLASLEEGEAAFDASSDLTGPVCLAVATASTQGEETKRGRFVAIGDSDFLTNAYIDLSGNRDFALNIFKWLVKDDRFIAIMAREPEFEPLFINAAQRNAIVFLLLIALPGSFLLLGTLRILWRKRTS